MNDRRSRDKLSAVQDDVIRQTTWANIRRYVLLGGMWFVILDLAVTLTVVVLLANATRQSDLEHSQAACKNTAALAAIQHTTVEQNAKATDDLVKSGNTLGLGRKEFDKLVREGNERNRVYLAALDKLAKADCETLKDKPASLTGG